MSLVNKEELRLSSRDIAEMMDIKHDTLLRKLDGRKDRRGIVEILNDNQMDVVEYFIESAYVDAKGETRKEYLISKKGCDMLAHKSTGEKGIIFTAKYIDKFEALKRKIVRDSYMIEDPLERAKVWMEEENRRRILLENLEINKTIVDTMVSNENLVSIFLVGKVLKSYSSIFGAKKIFSYLRNKNILMDRRGTQLHNTPYDIHSKKFEIKLHRDNIVTFFNKTGLNSFLNMIIREGLLTKDNKKNVLDDIENELNK